MLAFTPFAMDQGNTVLSGKCVNAAAEPPSEPHQMRIVEVVVLSKEIAPPTSETAAGLSHVKISVQHNTVHTIISIVNIASIQMLKLVRGHARPPLSEFSGENYAN